MWLLEKSKPTYGPGVRFLLGRAGLDLPRGLVPPNLPFRPGPAPWCRHRLDQTRLRERG